MNGDRIWTAMAMRVASGAIFAVMNAAAKLAEAGGATLGEIVFWRQTGATVLIAGMIAAGPGLGSIRTRRFGAHLARAAAGLTAMGLTFYALLALPLAEVTTIGFSVPVFATVLGALILKETIGWHRWTAVALGFAGVLIVTAPSLGAGSYLLFWGVVAGLAGSFGTANVSILLRNMGRSESPLTIVFWFSALSVVPLALVYAFTAQAHPLAVWGWMLTVGALGGVAQLAMTTSLRLGRVSAVVPMDYLNLIWATALGWWLFGALPGPTTWIGAPVIVGSGLYIIWREHVRRQHETVQAVAID